MKPSFRDYIGLLQKRADRAPDKNAFVYLNQEGDIASRLTYLELHHRAQTIAGYLANLCSSSSRVLLIFSQGLEFIPAFIGTLYHGATAVPVRLPEADQNMERFIAICADADASIVLTTTSLADYIGQHIETYTVLEGADMVRIEDIPEQGSEKSSLPHINPDNTAYLQYTSGATGAPKGVMVSHANMLYQNEIIKSAFHLSHRSRSLSWLPHFHYAGLLCGILQPLYSGFTGYLSFHGDFITHPYSWLHAISRHRITCSGGPNFAYEQCVSQISPEQKGSLDLSFWKIAWNGGESIQRKTVVDFFDNFKSCGLKASSYFPCYGLSEASLVVTGRDDTEDYSSLRVAPGALDYNTAGPARGGNREQREIMCCGMALKDVRVIVVNPLNRRPCKELEPGEIWVRSKGNATGYWRQPLLAKAAIQASLKDGDGDVWLRTGDWGFLEKGQLHVAGRIRDLAHTRNPGSRLPVPVPVYQPQAIGPGQSDVEPVAVIGMAGIFPQCDSCDQLWENIAAGCHLISEIPSERWDWKKIYGTPDNAARRTHIKWGGFIDDMAAFDASFFNISPKEAQYMDPMQRKMLQVVWQAVEDAGYRMSDLSGAKVGVFIGIGTFDYLQLIMENRAFVHAYAATGMVHCMVPNRISYLFNFTGPSEALDTACSSSLVALHRAMTALQSGECELAIVGGASTMLNSSVYVALSNANMLSEDGKCKTFDASADGYVRGEGVAAILLKPKHRARKDRDHIYGCIRGTAVNHGGHTNSLTAPNPFAQADVVTMAMRQAKIDPRTISYIETHGTGTRLGDPIEINGLKMAFGQLAEGVPGPGRYEAYCGLGTVKTNIGHLEAAAGIAGVIKVLMAMKYRKIPAHLHLETLNPNIDIEGSPFYIVDGTTRAWEALEDDTGTPLPRRAGVSSFGFGGVNAHAVIEENIASSLEIDAIKDVSPGLFVLSARTEAQLLSYGRLMAFFLNEHADRIDLEHLVYTLQVGREPMDNRLGIVATDLNDLITKIDSFLIDQKLALQIFPDNVFHGCIEPDLARIVFDESDNFGRELIDQLLREKDLVHLAQLWLLGKDIDWKALYRDNPRIQRMPLPTYPFAKENHWIPLQQDPGDASADENFQNTYDIQWLEAEKIPPVLDDDPRREIQFVLLCDQQGVGKSFADLLKKKNIAYHNVFYETSLAGTDTKAHVIHPFEKNSYLEVLDKIRAQGGERRNYILNFWPLDHPSAADYSLAEISDAVAFTCTSALLLVQSLIATEAASKDLVWFVCSDSQPVENQGPLNLKSAPLWGLAKTMLLEHHDVFRAIMDIESANPENAAATIFSEVMAYHQEGEIVYRNQKRYVPRLIPSSIQTGIPLKIKEDGTYLITGGLGTLGLLAARWLSEHKAGRVLLLSRNGLDPSRTDSLSQRKQKMLSTIQASGTQVDILLADVTDPEQMEKACRPYLQSEEIRGIFHAAGAFQPNFIKEMTHEDFMWVAGAKINGTWILHELTQGLSLDYFVMYSSAASIWGVASGAHYSAANSFLDSYIHYRSSLGLPGTSVNWGGMWKGSGIISDEDEKYMRSIGIKDTLPDTGLELLEAMLKSSDRQKVVAPVEWARFLQVIQVKRKHMLFEYIDSAGLSAANDAAESDDSWKAELLSLNEKDKISKIEEKLSGLLKDVIGIPNDAAVPADKGFFALGLDSLTSIDFKNKIRISLCAEISTTTLFDFNTLRLLAEHVSKTHFASAAPNLEENACETEETSESEETALNQYEKANLIEILKHEYDIAANS